MPKQKTHKATSKILKKKKNGTLTYKVSGGNHKTGKDTSKAVRQSLTTVRVLLTYVFGRRTGSSHIS